MRVGFLIDRWQPTRGGAERALAQLADFLAARGHDVRAFGAVGPRAGEAAPARFEAVRPRGWTRGARERDLAERLLDAAARARCDVTVGVRHLPRVDVLWAHGGTHAGTLAALGKRARGRHRAFLALEREAYAGGARRIVCVSRAMDREALAHYPACAPRLACVPNGVDLARFTPAARPAARARLDALFGGASAAPLLAFVGRNARLKGLPRALDALARLAGEPWRLVVAGPRDARRWAARARRAGLGPERVVVRPELDALDLAAGADLCLLPGRREPCGLVVLEALACGTPVLASDAVGARSDLGPAAGPVVAADGDARELADALAAELARLRAGAPDRAALRALVAERGLDAWLGRLERLLLESAP